MECWFLYYSASSQIPCKINTKSTRQMQIVVDFPYSGEFNSKLPFPFHQTWYDESFDEIFGHSILLCHPQIAPKLLSNKHKNTWPSIFIGEWIKPYSFIRRGQSIGLVHCPSVDYSIRHTIQITSISFTLYYKYLSSSYISRRLVYGFSCDHHI